MIFQFRLMAMMAIALLTSITTIAMANQVGINFSEDSYRSVRRLSERRLGFMNLKWTRKHREQITFRLPRMYQHSAISVLSVSSRLPRIIAMMLGTHLTQAGW